MATRLPPSCAGLVTGESSGTHSASLHLPMPRSSRVITSAPDSATRSLPVMPMSIAPSAQSTGMSSVRRNVMSIGISPTRANRLRSCRRKLSPACLSSSAASSLSRPLLGTPMRRFDISTNQPGERDETPRHKEREEGGPAEGWFIRRATQSLLVSFVSLWLSPLPRALFPSPSRFGPPSRPDPIGRTGGRFRSRPLPA